MQNIVLAADFPPDPTFVYSWPAAYPDEIGYVHYSGGDEIKVGHGVNYCTLMVNGTYVSSAQVFIENIRALVPVRVISEKMNAVVNWNDKTKQILAMSST